MSDCHILSINKTGKNIDVDSVFHLPVSTAMNKSNTMTIREAYREELGSSAPSAIPSLGTTHQTELDLGIITEETDCIRCHSTETAQEIKSRIEHRYLGLLPHTAYLMKEKYAYWGFKWDVTT